MGVKRAFLFLATIMIRIFSPSQSFLLRNGSNGIRRRTISQSRNTVKTPQYPAPINNNNNVLAFRPNAQSFSSSNNNNKTNSESTIPKKTQKHQKSYSLTANGTSGSTISRTDTNHDIRTDLPKRMGGTDTAPQPVEYLLASLIGCTQATAVFVARNMAPRLLIDRMEFDIEGVRDERGALDCLPVTSGGAVPDIPARLGRISGTVTVFLKRGRSFSGDELDVLAEHTEVRCPVMDMILSSGCVVDVSWVDGSSFEEEISGV